MTADMRLTEDEFLAVFVGVHQINAWETEATDVGSLVTSAMVTGLTDRPPVRIWYDGSSRSYVTSKGALYACRRHPRFKV